MLRLLRLNTPRSAIGRVASVPPRLKAVCFGGSRNSIVAWGEHDDHRKHTLERAFNAPAPRVTAECIRMAIFRRTNRVFDVELERTPSSPGATISLVVVHDTTLPERQTAVYMRKLADIAEVVTDLGLVHQLMRGIESQLPVEGPTPESSVVIRLV